MNHVLPIFNPRLIQDHNIEGYDSVDSEDFEPGFGCVVERIQPIIALPEMIDNRTEEEIRVDNDNRKWFFMTDKEKQDKEDEYLKNYGL